jgi:hypothetical protein
VKSITFMKCDACDRLDALTVSDTHESYHCLISARPGQPGWRCAGTLHPLPEAGREAYAAAYALGGADAVRAML